MPIRLVGYSERDPGYINNVAGPASLSDLGCAPDNSQYQRTLQQCRHRRRPRGLEGESGRQLSILPSLIYQKQSANGSFAYEQNLGYLNVATYEPMRNADQWYQRH